MQRGVSIDQQPALSRQATSEVQRGAWSLGEAMASAQAAATPQSNAAQLAIAEQALELEECELVSQQLEWCREKRWTPDSRPRSMAARWKQEQQLAQAAPTVPRQKRLRVGAAQQYKPRVPAMTAVSSERRGQRGAATTARHVRAAKGCVEAPACSLEASGRVTSAAAAARIAAAARLRELVRETGKATAVAAAAAAAATVVATAAAAAAAAAMGVAGAAAAAAEAAAAAAGAATTRGTGLVSANIPDYVDSSGTECAPPCSSGVAWDGSLLIMRLARPEAGMVGECMVLHGLQRFSCLNGQVVRVLRAMAGSTRLQVLLRWEAQLRIVNVKASKMKPFIRTGWCPLHGDEWPGEAAPPPSIMWLSPSDFKCHTWQACADLFADMNPIIFPGREKERHVNIEATYYPLVRPRANLAAESTCNPHVSEQGDALLATLMPMECCPEPTEVIPLPEQPKWDFSRAFPMPWEVCRAKRKGEKLEPWKAVASWCSAYHCEWSKVVRGMQPGKRRHRFCYDKLPGGRQGLIIHDYIKPELQAWQWDHRPFYGSCEKYKNGRINAFDANALPCLPMQDTPAQRFSEWNLATMAADAEEMSFVDKNIIYELGIGFRSFSAAVRDNKVCLWPNYRGFFEFPDFVNTKSEEERTGFRIPKLFGSYQYPPTLCARLHPRNVASQRIPIPGSGGGWSVKQRQTVDAGAPREPGGPMNQAAEGRVRMQQVSPDDPSLLGIDLGLRRPDLPKDVYSFNEQCPLKDAEFNPPLRYGSVDAFARGLGVLESAGMRLGMFKMDMRAYYRFMVSQCREVHCAFQWVHCGRGFECDHNLQFGQAPNCGISTRVSQFLLTKIRYEMAKEKQRWRDEGLLEQLPADDQEKLRAWEQARWQAQQPVLDALMVQWMQDLWSALELTGDQQAMFAEWSKEAETGFLGVRSVAGQALHDQRGIWCADMESRVTPWNTEGCFIDDFYAGGFEWWVPTMIKIFNDVFEKYGIETADGRPDPYNNNKPTKCKFEVSFAAMEILGIVLMINIPGGMRRMAEARAALYAETGEAMVGSKYVPLEDFQSFVGRIVFASQALPKLRGAIAGLLGTMRQRWSTGERVRLGKAAWSMISLCCTVLHENSGMVLLPMTQPPGANNRPVVWVFSDSARDIEGADAGKFVGWGYYCWPEGCSAVFVRNGQWLRHEQEQLHITALELHCQSMALEQAQMPLELAQMAAGAAFGTDTSTEGADLILVIDNKGAELVSNRVRASSPALRVLVEQRMRRVGSRKNQRVFAQHAHRELSCEPDDLSKNELEALHAHLYERFHRRMDVIFMPPPTEAWRSLFAAQEAEGLLARA